MLKLGKQQQLWEWPYDEVTPLSNSHTAGGLLAMNCTVGTLRDCPCLVTGTPSSTQAAVISPLPSEPEVAFRK